MKIEIKYVGKTTIEGLESNGVFHVEEGTTIEDFLMEFEVKKEFHPFIIPFINGEHQSTSYVFQEKDELDLFLPVSGG